MRPRSSPSWAQPFVSSWKSLVLSCLALSQVLTIYLLLRIAGSSRDDSAQQNLISEAVRDRREHARAAAPRPPSVRKSLRRILSVGERGVPDPAEATARTCVPQTISPGRCSNEAGAVQRPAQDGRETCAFGLDETEVVFGVWHSLATEGRLQPLLETWGSRAQVVLLASSVGVRESKLFREGVPGSRPHLLGERPGGVRGASTVTDVILICSCRCVVPTTKHANGLSRWMCCHVVLEFLSGWCWRSLDSSSRVVRSGAGMLCGAARLPRRRTARRGRDNNRQNQQYLLLRVLGISCGAV